MIEEVPRSENGIAGKLNMSEDVVAKIAGLAARDIKGIHSLGPSRMIPFRSAKRGVPAEVGQKEAALDLEIVIEYGCNLREVAAVLRKRVAEEVDKMAGRKVVEVNVNVVGVHIPEPDEVPPPPETRRVR